MQHSGIRRAACVVALWVGITLPAGASEDTNAIVEFFNVAGIAETAARAKAESMGDTFLAKFTADSIALFDQKELTRRLGTVLEKFLAAEDIAQFRAFIATPAGERVAKAFREMKSPEDLGKALDAFPEGDKKATEAFFTSSAMSQTVKAINSPELAEVAKGYGVELACRHAAGDPAIMEKLNASGVCKKEG